MFASASSTKMDSSGRPVDVVESGRCVSLVEGPLLIFSSNCPPVVVVSAASIVWSLFLNFDTRRVDNDLGKPFRPYELDGPIHAGTSGWHVNDQAYGKAAAIWGGLLLRSKILLHA